MPIGWVESPLTDRAQAPRQVDESAPDAWLVFEPGAAAGIRDFDAGTEVLVLGGASVLQPWWGEARCQQRHRQMASRRGGTG